MGISSNSEPWQPDLTNTKESRMRLTQGQPATSEEMLSRAHDGARTIRSTSSARPGRQETQQAQV